jgi:hypothetical protein
MKFKVLAKKKAGKDIRQNHRYPEAAHVLRLYYQIFM